MITKESEDRLKAWLHWKTAELERGQLDESEKLFYSDIKGLLAERDAYRELSIREHAKTKSFIHGRAAAYIPDEVLVDVKWIDAEAARILEGKGEKK